MHRFVVIDDLWRVLQAAKGMVARVAALTRSTAPGASARRS
ncbi:MAG: hypothetical protein ACRDZX_02050 [Acidimicrobiales bacterium]